MIKTTDILRAIAQGNFSDRELRDINSAIVNDLKAKRNAKVAAAKRKFGVGDKVRFGHRSGKIVKVNRTKCVVEVPAAGIFGSNRWNVPMTMLEAV